jgi:hypothetical protein
MCFHVPYIARLFFTRQGLSLVLFDVFLFRFGFGGWGEAKAADGRVAQLVDALCHKTEGFVFDSRYGAWKFSSAHIQ